MFTLPPFALLRRMAQPTPFLSPFFLPSSRDLFILGDFNCHHPLRNLMGTSDLRGEEVFDWVISSDLPSMTLTYPLSSIAPSLTSPLLSPLLPFLAHGRCFRTWVLITYQFFYLSLSLRSFTPTNVPFLQFLESSLGSLCFLFRLSLSFCSGLLVSFLCRYSLQFSGIECGQVFHSFRPHQRPS